MKYILKKTASKVIPQEIINAPKIPSTNDVMFWVNTDEFIHEFRNIISLQDSFSRDYLNFDEVNQLILEHELSQSYSHLCWYIFALEHWYRKSFLQ